MYERVYINNNCRFNDSDIDGNCDRGDEPQTISHFVIRPA